MNRDPRIVTKGFLVVLLLTAGLFVWYIFARAPAPSPVIDYLIPMRVSGRVVGAGPLGMPLHLEVVSGGLPRLRAEIPSGQEFMIRRGYLSHTAPQAPQIPVRINILSGDDRFTTQAIAHKQPDPEATCLIDLGTVTFVLHERGN